MAKSEFNSINYGNNSLREIREENRRMKNETSKSSTTDRLQQNSGSSSSSLDYQQNRQTLSGSGGVGKRGRKPAKLDVRMKLERSQQSARECRARKKLRYQYLEELVASREKAIVILKKELEMYKNICKKIDENQPLSREIVEALNNHATNINNNNN